MLFVEVLVLRYLCGTSCDRSILDLIALCTGQYTLFREAINRVCFSGGDCTASHVFSSR